MTDSMLLYCTLVLSGFTALLSSTAVRHAVADYFESPPAGITLLIEENSTEAPGTPATDLEWKLPIGN